MPELPNRATLLRWALALAIGAAALFFVDWDKVLEEFRPRHILAIAAAQPVQLLGLFLVSWRFALLSRCGSGHLGVVFRAYLLSVGMNTFVPGRLTELLKVSYLREKASLPASSSLAAVLLERLMDVAYLGLFVLLGMGSLWIDIDPLVLGGSVVTMILGTLLLPRFEPHLRALLDRIPMGAAGTFLQRTVGEASARVRERSFLLAMLLGSFSWGLSFLLVWLVLVVLFGEAITWHDGLIVFSAMAVGRAIPALPAGLGTFEAAVVLAMHHLGFTFAEALSAALTLHASQLVVVSVIALVLMAADGTGITPLLRDARKALKHG